MVAGETMSSEAGVLLESFDFAAEISSLRVALEKVIHHHRTFITPIISLFKRQQRLIVDLCPYDADNPGQPARDGFALIPALGADLAVYAADAWIGTQPRPGLGAVQRLVVVALARADLAATCAVYPYARTHDGKVYWVTNGSGPELSPPPAAIADAMRLMMTTTATSFSLPEGVTHLRRNDHLIYVGNEVRKLQLGDSSTR